MCDPICSFFGSVCPYLGVLLTLLKGGRSEDCDWADGDGEGLELIKHPKMSRVLLLSLVPRTSHSLVEIVSVLDYPLALPSCKQVWDFLRVTHILAHSK